MLRVFVVGIGLVLLLLGAVLTRCMPAGPGWGLMIMGGLILLGTVWERFRYKPVHDVDPGPGWSDTGERFRDPESGDLLAVYGRQSDGERRYVRLGRGRAA